MGEPRTRTYRRFVTIGFAAAAAVAVAVAVPAMAEGQVLGAGAANAVPGSYIVVFNDGIQGTGVAAAASSTAAKYGGQVKATYADALHGFAATMTERQAKRLAADSSVAFVEQDQEFHLLADQLNPPSWGLDRVDQRNLPLDNKYTSNTTASNVTAYIIDTGVRVTHRTFGGRAVFAFNAVGDGNNTDCNGHGTHVAGTVGGSEFGLAKAVHLRAYKVLNCQGSGTTQQVVSGINRAASDHPAGQPAVANMSLGGGASTAIDNAVRAAIADGITFAVASGNSNANACNSSPARVAEAITVNASDRNDARASFSNFGTCTDIFAPGVGITSSWGSSDTATNTISGTSMATPHVAGAAALYLAAHPSATPATVAGALNAGATSAHITNPGAGSPNRLLFSLVP
ncbi:MAG: S8 family peptidase [Labedaea sp.]